MDELEAVGALGDPVRRHLYERVANSRVAIGRQEVAEACGVPEHSARFHLDKLVEQGLLDVEFRRLGGRTGPGAGRPTKLYRRSDRVVEVSLPARRYQLAGNLLAAAVERAMTGESMTSALTEAAAGAGRSVGCEQVGPRRTSHDSEAQLDDVAAVLATEGFEPGRDDDGVVVWNCPFDELARVHRELICGLNRDFVGGVVDGLGCDALAARLDPAPDRCCVRVSVAQPD